MFKRDWTTSSNIDKYSTLNSEHNLEDLCIQLRNQQTCTFDNHDCIRGGMIFIAFLHMFHHRFANLARGLLYESNR